MNKISIVTPTYNEEENIQKLCDEIKGEMEKIDGVDVAKIKYYSGNFKNGNKEGKGKFFSTGQYSYEGQWKNDKLNGKGILKVWGTDEKFEGYFKDDLKLKGTWTLSKKFISEFLNIDLAKS